MRTELAGVWRKFASPVAMLAAAAVLGFAVAGCGSGDTTTTTTTDTTTTTPTDDTPGGGTGGDTGGDTGFGNNFAGALIFADNVGISGVALDTTKAWTSDPAAMDYNTGLRPLSTETGFAALPYLDSSTTYLLDGVTYYKQQTASTWQGQWVAGGNEQQHVTAKWGDNLVSQHLTTNSVVRVEMGLTKALTTPMTSYKMVLLYGSQTTEMQGTDGTTYDNSTASVFAANAHLTIQKLDAGGAADGTPVVDRVLWEGDGPGFLAGEVSVGGAFTYGFVWNIKNVVLPGDVTTGVAGTWRLTFSLDNTSPVGTSNNTFIDAATNGVLDDSRQVHIDITVAQQ